MFSNFKNSSAWSVVLAKYNKEQLNTCSNNAKVAENVKNKLTRILMYSLTQAAEFFIYQQLTCVTLKIFVTLTIYCMIILCDFDE